MSDRRLAAAVVVPDWTVTVAPETAGAVRAVGGCVAVAGQAGPHIGTPGASTQPAIRPRGWPGVGVADVQAPQARINDAAISANPRFTEVGRSIRDPGSIRTYCRILTHRASANGT